jgi:hypothetical protein
MLQALTSFLLLGLISALPSEQALIGPLPPIYLQQQGLLEVLPYPILMPTSLPEGVELLDVRLSLLPHPGLQQQQSYTLVYLAGQRSFALQSRLLNYQQPACQNQLHHRSQPIRLQGLAGDLQQLELVSPACALNGQLLTSEGLQALEADRIWNSLRWYLPLVLR